MKWMILAVFVAVVAGCTGMPASKSNANSGALDDPRNDKDMIYRGGSR